MAYRYVEWIQETFTVEPLKNDLGLIFSKMVQISPWKSELQAENRRLRSNRRYSLVEAPNPNRIAQTKCPKGVVVFLQKRAFKPLWIQLTDMYVVPSGMMWQFWGFLRLNSRNSSFYSISRLLWPLNLRSEGQFARMWKVENGQLTSLT